MATLLTKHSTLILILLVLTFFTLAWLFPSEGLMIGAIFLSLSILIASFVVFQKYKEFYLQGKISSNMFLRNVLMEMTGVVLVMVLAGFLGRNIAEMVMSQITDNLTRLSVGILIGLLTGSFVSVLIIQLWSWGVAQKLHVSNWRLK